MKYFRIDIPFNKDIERHREHEAKLRAMIADLEAVENPDEFQQGTLKAYHHLLDQLLQSKAEVTSKIGTDKRKK